MKSWHVRAAAVLFGLGMLAACDSGVSDDLAPYRGERPLTLLRVTQSYTPDLQWVGGRVAAVGVNRGDRAALDETLVWLMTAPEDTINRFVRFGQHTNEVLVRQYGGTPVDSLADDTEYTFWLATREAFDAGLAPGAVDSFNFVDTTVTVTYLLKGRSGGDPNLGTQITIVREQTLLSDRYTVRWAPDGHPFRQIGLSRGTLGAFDNLIWHVVLPDGVSGSIRPPVILGQPPEGTATAIEFPATGFEPSTYILWMTTPDWKGSFGLRAEGYAYYQIFPANFE